MKCWSLGENARPTPSAVPRCNCFTSPCIGMKPGIYHISASRPGLNPCITRSYLMDHCLPLTQCCVHEFFKSETITRRHWPNRGSIRYQSSWQFRIPVGTRVSHNDKEGLWVHDWLVYIGRMDLSTKIK